MESKMTRGVPGIENSSLQFIPAYLGYKLYLVNSEHQMNTDTYPISLVDAIQRSTSFEASWIADSVSIPPSTPTINAFGAQRTPGDKRPKGGKTQGKGKG
jgi:hypothetical protein